jgi:sortase A
MASARFKRIFLIRFVSYFSILISIVWTLALVFPIITAEFTYRRDRLLGVRYTLDPGPVRAVASPSGGIGLLSGSSETATSSGGFSEVRSDVHIIKPVSTEFGIVIEKINANAKIIPDVDPGNEAQYTQALNQGVAQSKGSTLPGQPGNLYIFSHSTNAPWNVSRLNAVFYLLRELETGDKAVIFYQGKRYDYEVYEKTVTDAYDTSFLTNRYDKPVLTLQTCDPPGTLTNRLIVRAKLLGS